ncbi:MAG: hypothetical protein M0Z59_10650 [Nitrospiraceae bacterium]|nr:hypothetical protein [Nitrospiraceae bacterium]
MKSAMGFILFAAVIVVFLLVFSGRKYPPIPDDPWHAAITSEKACMACHGPGRQYPLKAAHPPKFSCFKCHKFPKR